MVGKAVLGLLLLIALAALSACDCGGTSDEASATSDDDSIGDDDSSLDDDVTDDDAGTTTTTSPTTTTTGGTGTTTTTTVATTTTTTTSTMNPGTGTACDPFNKIPTVIDREKPYGPWPEFEERGITFRQIIASGAGQGQNDVLVTDDGLVRVAAQDGRSLDVIAVGSAGEVSREVVDPRGGEWKVLGKDADENLYLLYTVHVDQSPETWEVRAATNKSGEWVRELLFTSNDDGNLSLDMAVDADGLMHIVFCGRDDSAVAWYATWDGATYTETQLAASPGSWRYAYAMALDSAGMPHALLSESTGVWHWRIEDGLWTGDLATGNAFAWDLVIDANDVMHAGLAANGGHLVYGRFESGAWTFEDLDDCQDGVSFINVEVEGDGHVHIAYTNGDQDDVLYATNASGAWVHTFLYEENTEFDFGHALDMASALDADGKIHIVHRRYNDYDSARDSDLNLTTNAIGQWVRRRIIKGDRMRMASAALDSNDRLHVALARLSGEDRMIYGLLSEDDWTEVTIESITEPGSVRYFALALMSDGTPGIIYGTSNGVSGDTDRLRYAAPERSSWATTTIHDTGITYGGPQLQYDTLNRPHVFFNTTYLGGDQHTEWGFNDDDWNFEVIPDPKFFGSLMIDYAEQPVIAYGFYSPDEEGIRVIRRTSVNSWQIELVLSTDGDAFAPISSMREDGTIDLIANISNDSILPSGSFYGTNIDGPWAVEHMLISGGGTFARDFENKIHYVLFASAGVAPDPVGLYYITNINDNWEFFPIDTTLGEKTSYCTQQMSNSRLITIYSNFFGLASATFWPGMP